MTCFLLQVSSQPLVTAFVIYKANLILSEVRRFARQLSGAVEGPLHWKKTPPLRRRHVERLQPRSISRAPPAILLIVPRGSACRACPVTTKDLHNSSIALPPIHPQIIHPYTQKGDDGRQERADSPHPIHKLLMP